MNFQSKFSRLPATQPIATYSEPNSEPACDSCLFCHANILSDVPPTEFELTYVSSFPICYRCEDKMNHAWFYLHEAVKIACGMRDMVFTFNAEVDKHVPRQENEKSTELREAILNGDYLKANSFPQNFLQQVMRMVESSPVPSRDVNQVPAFVAQSLPHPASTLMDSDVACTSASGSNPSPFLVDVQCDNCHIIFFTQEAFNEHRNHCSLYRFSYGELLTTTTTENDSPAHPIASSSSTPTARSSKSSFSTPIAGTSKSSASILSSNSSQIIQSNERFENPSSPLLVPNPNAFKPTSTTRIAAIYNSSSSISIAGNSKSSSSTPNAGISKSSFFTPTAGISKSSSSIPTGATPKSNPSQSIQFNEPFENPFASLIEPDSFKCQVCERMYSTEDNRRRHERKRHKIFVRPFKCRVCQAHFANEFYRSVHERRKHRFIRIDAAWT